MDHVAMRERMIRDATSLDRLRGDLDIAAEELRHDAGHQTAEVTSLLQLSTSVARLSYDLKAHMRAHRR
jgi:hypothetical protein